MKFDSFFSASRRVSVCAMLPLALAIIASPAHAGNLVLNGSFETNGGVGELTNGITSLADWNVGPTVVNNITPSTSTPPFDFVLDANADSTGFPSLYSPPNIYVWGPNSGVNNGFTGSPDGGYFFGSDGGYASAPIWQTITGLTVGDQYTLSFDWAASQFTGYTGATTQDWQVTFGDSTVTTTPYSLPSQGFSGWMSFSDTFTATSTSQTLSFLAQGTPNGLPPFTLLDGVDLEEGTTPPPPSTPEPASLMLLLGGAAGIFGFRRLTLTKKRA